NTEQSVYNGLDLEMGTWTDGLTTKGTSPYSAYYLANPYLQGLKSGKYSIRELDQKVTRLLRMIFRTTMSADRPFGKYVSPEHSEAARKIAEQGIVLLKNDKQTLPVAVSSKKQIVVVGENAVRSLVIGGGSSSLKVAYEISPLQGLKNKYGQEHIQYAAGYTSKDKATPALKDSLLYAAVGLAKTADVVLFVGGLNKDFLQDSEGDDRKSLALPYEQSKLISELAKVNKNVVVILASGNAVEMPWLSNVQAVLQAWYLGSEAGNAIANIVSGDVNPTGKLPFSFPKKIEDNAAHSFGTMSYPGDGKKQEYMEDILVGYRWFDTKKISPLFPFGYGLSYTTFEYGKISTDKKEYASNETIKLSFTLKNTGKTAGAEIAQIYMSQPKASVVRPVKELKSFKKVFLSAGETRTVELEVKVQDMAFYNDKTHAWEVEPGEFVLCNASSSADVKSKISVRII
ncbi:MAG TPA: glycoside hydrolase family 3 C-terminal domain-containing protein, partial [Paludibacter sp.]